MEIAVGQPACGRGSGARERAGLRWPTRPARGFTLIEILLVLALLALFSALFVPGVNSILRQINERGPEQALAEAILAARGAALESGRTVTLTYDDQKRTLRADSPSVSDLVLEAGSQLTLLPPTAGAVILLGGQAVETEELRRIRFFPDGTCDPFRVRLQRDKDSARVWTADPWTCALSPEAPAK
ncbi:MAG: GspH/FimT family pseudopilin [Opitutaceae bacterium]|nr:GspH/FimT family pseudopilin [Opitutaceae bacterium]